MKIQPDLEAEESIFIAMPNSPANFNDRTGLSACRQKNIDQGERELEKALNNAQIMGQGVFKKYKKCLLKPFPEVKCDPTDKGCGYHHPFSPSTITISPLGAAGRKGPRGPVASTLLHELVHLCYRRAWTRRTSHRSNRNKRLAGRMPNVRVWVCVCSRPEEVRLLSRYVQQEV